MENYFVEKLKSKPQETTSEAFAIAFRVYVDMILGSKHVYGVPRTLEMIEELNAAYVKEKIRRRL